MKLAVYFIFISFSEKVTCEFLASETIKILSEKKHFFQARKNDIPHYYQDKGAKNNVVNLTYSL